MATYVTLFNFTDQGLRNVKDTVKRMEAAKQAGSEIGVKLKEFVWTLGQHDIIAISEAADETAAAASLMNILKGATSALNRCAPSRRRKWKRFWRKSLKSQRGRRQKFRRTPSRQIVATSLNTASTVA